MEFLRLTITAMEFLLLPIKSKTNLVLKILAIEALHKKCALFVALRVIHRGVVTLRKAVF